MKYIMRSGTVKNFTVLLVDSVGAVIVAGIAAYIGSYALLVVRDYEFIFFVSLLIYYIFKIHLFDLKHIGHMAFLKIAFSNMLIVAIVFCEQLVTHGYQHAQLIKFGIPFFSVLVLMQAGYKELFRWSGFFWRRANNRAAYRKGGMLVYGCDTNSIEIVSALRVNGRARVAGFLSEDINKVGREVGGLPVYSINDVGVLAEKGKITDILIPKTELSDRLLELVRGLPVNLKMVPNVSDAIVKGAFIKEIEALDIDLILGRKHLDQISKNATNIHKDKRVLVTGAAGSIGAEISRQIAMCSPKKLVLLDVSEEGMYSLEREFHANYRHIVNRCLFKLGRIQDERLVNSILKEEEIDVVYHAAAYKHVPLLEFNMEQAISNNTFGTSALLEACVRNGVKKFLLISTDKAVRPTNIMGMSKRFAEMLVQSVGRYGVMPTVAGETIKSMVETKVVRFGNVLGSSGSVIPLFEEQIRTGGPLTVTHKDVTRYFMSIPEAVALVLGTSAMRGSGELFILDMAEPRKIDDLARQMIKLMGYSVAGEENIDGREEIVIEYIGLREGEKMYEELLVDKQALRETENGRVFRVDDPVYEVAYVSSIYRQLREIVEQDIEGSIKRRKIIQLLEREVIGKSKMETPVAT